MDDFDIILSLSIASILSLKFIFSLLKSMSIIIFIGALRKGGRVYVIGDSGR